MAKPQTLASHAELEYKILRYRATADVSEHDASTALLGAYVGALRGD